MGLSISTLLKYYKRLEIQQAILDCAEDREIAVKFGDRGFGRRPDVLKYPRDVLEFAKRGATSFHCSEELWSNPLQISTGLKAEELNRLRIGWDLLLDIDCKELEFSKIVAFLLIEALKHFGVKNFSVKFSGNHGFHIGVPFEAFPEFVGDRPVKDLFPDGPKRIAFLLQEKIRSVLVEKLLSKFSIDLIAEKVGKSPGDLLFNNSFDPFKVVDIDTVLISSRHLFRMPFVFNEKSGLVSVVIKPEDIFSFSKDSAVPENVVPKLKFLDRSKTVPGEAKRLIVEAFDFKPDIKVEETKSDEYIVPLEDAVPENCFPPCIKNILKGLEDGKKRALFILINFLSSLNWDFGSIEKFVFAWNKRNKEPLRDVYLKGQLKYSRINKRVLPPNCDNEAYMKGINVCQPDSLCQKIKNPVNYAIRKFRAGKRGSGKK